MVGPRCFVERGFRTSEAGHAYLEGVITPAVPIPEVVQRELPSRRPQTGATRRLPRAIEITEAVLSATVLRTDRGPLRLPAWRLSATGALGPIWVLDPEVDPPEWRPPEPPAIPRPKLRTPLGDPGARVDVAADDRTLTLHHMGALPEYEQYPRAEVIETPRAVAIVPQGRDVGGPGIRILPGHIHLVTVRLSRALGARVVVDLHGNAVEAASGRP